MAWLCRRSSWGGWQRSSKHTTSRSHRRRSATPATRTAAAWATVDERHMSTDSPDRGEGFLSRWSRVKTEARDEASREATAPAETASAPPVLSSTDSEPPPLPPVDELTLESDFRGFFHPKVDEDVRRAALRKLFSDPHFNVMD